MIFSIRRWGQIYKNFGYHFNKFIFRQRLITETNDTTSIKVLLIRKSFSNYQQNFLKLNNTPYLAITLVQYSPLGFDEIGISFSGYCGSFLFFVFKRLWMLNVTNVTKMSLNITKMINFPLCKQTRDPNILDVIQLYIYSQILKEGFVYQFAHLYLLSLSTEF